MSHTMCDVRPTIPSAYVTHSVSRASLTTTISRLNGLIEFHVIAGGISTMG
jgi:hypothetical protein